MADEKVAGREPGQRSPAERLASVLARLAALGAILASVGGIVLHVSGSAAQRSYLRAFNIDPDAFPRAADWVLLNGYFTIVDLGSTIVGGTLTWVGFVVLATLSGLVGIYRWKPKGRVPPQSVVRLTTVLPGWLKQALLNVSIAYLLLAVLFFIVAVAVLAAIVPWATGDTYGEDAARADIARFKKGCGVTQCSEIWRDSQKVAQGWVIATAPEHVAFYDAKRSAVRLVERKGLEIVSPVSQDQLHQKAAD